MTKSSIARAATFAGVLLALGTSAGAAYTGVNVTTYHYDNYRTGWNSAETILTPARVGYTGSTGKTFQMLDFVALDDQVDAQPLVMTNQTITGHGTHAIVVYVVTENNSIYAIDGVSGKVVLKKNFGAPVPESELPGGCNNNAANVGITSTPVIDAANSTMYVMVYTNDNGSTPTYRIHALDLSSLTDLVTPVVVTASGKLSNGKSFAFNASVSRQRPALLLANGNVYAGFGSFCDAANNLSRGWVLGWNTGTLTPLASNELVDKLAKSPDDFFLSSVWMAGYGLASGGPNGDIYFVTGNSDGGEKADGSVYNLGESVVQMSPDLSTVVSTFTPNDANSLDQGDTDFGSGGALLLPPQTGQTSDLLVAAGKEGNMFFLNGDNLDNNTTGPKRILGTYNIGNCWCGESYFTGSDGIGRVVSSGAYTMEIWKVLTGATPKLAQEAGTGNMSDGGVQDPGFFTSVSTNGTTANTGIVWGMSRADGTANENVALFAFDATNGKTLYTANAGTWPNVSGDADLVPVVANGRVYVASYQGLSIFGLAAASASPVKPQFPPYVATRIPLAPGQHEIYGMVHAIDGAAIVVQKRDGALVTVDASQAAKDHNLAPVSVGHGVLARGTYNAAGALAASVVLHAKDHITAWLPDR